MGCGGTLSLHSRSHPAEPTAWGLAFGKAGLDLLVRLNHSPPAPDAEPFKHKGGTGQLLSAVRSKLTQSSRSRTAVGTEAGVAEDRGLSTGREMDGKDDTEQRRYSKQGCGTGQ